MDLVIAAARYDEVGEQFIGQQISEHGPGLAFEAMGLSYSHRVTIPLGDAIRTHALDRPMHWSAAEAARLARATQEPNRIEALRVIDALTTAGIRFQVLKGALLDSLLYPPPSPRWFNDLDLYVNSSEASGAHEVLTTAGYVQGELSSDGTKITPFSSERAAGYHAELQHAPEYIRLNEATGKAHKVDLHHRLSTVFDHVAIDADLLESMTYETRNGSIPGLAPEDMLCHLAYHAWWDTQSLGNIANCRDLRIYQLADIRLFLRAKFADVPSAMRRARELGCAETTNWALVVVGNLWDDVLDSTSALDVDAALEFDARVADRWLQRDTSTPIIRWDSPAWERVRDPQRGDWALQSFFQDYITAHTRRGDVLSWIERS